MVAVADEAFLAVEVELRLKAVIPAILPATVAVVARNFRRVVFRVMLLAPCNQTRFVRILTMRKRMRGSRGAGEREDAWTRGKVQAQGEMTRGQTIQNALIRNAKL